MIIPNQSKDIPGNANVSFDSNIETVTAQAISTYAQARTRYGLTDNAKCIISCGLGCAGAGPFYWQCFSICTAGCSIVFGNEFSSGGLAIA